MPKAHIKLQVGLIWALVAALRHAGCVHFTNEDVMGCMRTVVGCVRGEDVLISPWWAGHPLCIAKLGWLGYVYNMRAYSCGLNTSFSLVRRKVPKSYGKEVYKHTREPEKDRARLPDSIASTVVFAGDGEYSVAFHRALVHMFGLQKDSGSTYDRLTVETGRPCSFTQFLRESCRTKKEAHYVLAALVLLSEGVDVPIETAGNKVILKKRKDSEEALVDAHISVPAVESGESPPSETWQVVNFFKRYRGTHMLPSTYEEFKTGEFLESPQLLILTYIGEYVGNAEELMSVMECIFKLVEGVGLAESVGDPGSVVGRIFVRAEQLPKAGAYLGPFLGAQKKMERMRIFGEFVHVQKHLNSPSYCERVTDESDSGEPSREDPLSPEICPEYSGLKEADSSDDSDMLQSTISGPANLESRSRYICPERALCLLLLCLAYDPEEMEYDLQGLLERIKQTAESAEVRAAILALQAHAEERTFFGAFSSLDWTETDYYSKLDIVEQLVDIWKKGNLRILDLMREFATKTGQPQNVVDCLVSLSGSQPKVHGNILDAEALERISAVVRSLAVHRQAQIEIVGDLDKLNCCRYAVRVKHPHKDKRRQQTFEMVACEWYVKSYMQLPDPFLSGDVLKNMHSLAAQYRQDMLFSSFVFAECVDRMVLRCNQRRDLDIEKEILWRAARKTAKRSAERPNRALLGLPIVGVKLREELSAKIVLFAHRYGVALSASHPIARLVANVIGSAGLEEEYTREGILKVPLFVGIIEELCPSARPPKGCTAAPFEYYRRTAYRDVYAKKKCMFFTGRVAMEHIRMCAAYTGRPLFNCTLLKGYRCRENVSCFLAAERPGETLEEIITLVRAEHTGRALAEANALVRKLLFTWLFAALSSSEAAVHCELIVWVCQELGREGFFRGCKEEVSDFNFKAVSKALAPLEDARMQRALASIGWAKLDMLKRALCERRELCLRFRM
ncbi:uncharacterized protein NEMAJ01_1168 [Nematocida major]|uniref:uncharacterized protein n=1 Tax=Nematocida major TaxID=1912982 RepID=UPI002007CA5D|nr:uncharacterized protein NEMAJ01_1168 [Nematocida major]KAH9386272.1 hypothetical protein NEMAJ01_1168 [Nematocida major]